MTLDIRRLGLMILVILPAFSYSQDRTRPLRGSVNTRGYNNILPRLSGDGNTLVYMNDYSDDHAFYINISRRDAGGKWSAGEELIVTKPAISLMHGGYCLSFDGTTLIFTTRTGNGVGGYDLWWTVHDENGWSASRNFGAPVNSPAHEGYPSLSPDGNMLYFARCQSAGAKEAKDCKILVAERKRGRIKGWEPPIELPSDINSGSSLMPRIFTDSKTLYFVSAKSISDLNWYITRNDGENWSPPEIVDFLNSREDKMSMGTYYRPDMIVATVKNDRGKYNFVEIKIPERFMPEKVVIKTGKVLNENEEPIRSDIRLVDYNSGTPIGAIQPDIETGDYTIIIPEGMEYDFSVNSRGGPELYHSELLDLNSLRSSRKESKSYTLGEIHSGTTLSMHVLRFEDNNTVVDPRSDPEIKRLVRLLSRNEQFDFTIHAYQDTVMYDSIPRPDLTEVIADTLVTYEVVLLEDSVQSTLPDLETVQIDSIITVWNDSLESVKYDTLLAELFLASLTGTVDSIEHKEVKYTYHNDLTQKRADALAELLVGNDVDASRISAEGHADQSRPRSVFDPEELKKGAIEIVFK